MTIEVVQFNAAQSNFGLLIHDREAGVTAAVDSADWKAVARETDKRGWQLTHMLITHHHGDHTDGLADLKAKYGCAIYGPAAEAEKIKLLDRTFHDGEHFTLGNVDVRVMATPGHTAGHISYYIAEAGLVFVGDTLFSLGCGRLFEGTPAMMWHSLQKLAELPAQTLIYCGHEYTADNARFALTIEPNNLDLAGRAEEVRTLVADGRPTLPVTIGDELKANPFLRADRPRLKRALGMTGADAVDVFAEIRGRKDKFK